jgi:hypothetical protein
MFCATGLACTPDEQILAGEAANCKITCGTWGSVLKQGARVRGKLNIRYEDKATLFTHTVVGDLIADVS